MKKIKKIVLGCLLSLGLSNNLIAIEIENLKDLVSDQQSVTYRNLVEMGAEISIPIGIKNSDKLVFLDIKFYPEPFPKKLYYKNPLKFEEIPAPKMFIRLPSGKIYDVSPTEVVYINGRSLKTLIKPLKIELDYCKSVQAFQYTMAYRDLERMDMNSYGKIAITNNKIFCNESKNYLPDELFRALKLENI